MVGANPYASNELSLVKFEPHLHTLHSDGQDTVAAMFAACRSVGYEAVALTDHNTLSGLAEAETAAAELGLILVPGVEIIRTRSQPCAKRIELGTCGARRRNSSTSSRRNEPTITRASDRARASATARAVPSPFNST